MSIESAKRLSIRETLSEMGYDSIEEAMTDSEINGIDGTSIACCEHTCCVEPDGKCPHGHPSILIALGLI